VRVRLRDVMQDVGDDVDGIDEGDVGLEEGGEAGDAVRLIHRRLGVAVVRLEVQKLVGGKRRSKNLNKPSYLLIAPESIKILGLDIMSRLCSNLLNFFFRPWISRG
jgi:hypothetical protein